MPKKKHSKKDPHAVLTGALAAKEKMLLNQGGQVSFESPDRPVSGKCFLL